MDYDDRADKRQRMIDCVAYEIVEDFRRKNKYLPYSHGDRDYPDLVPILESMGFSISEAHDLEPEIIAGIRGSMDAAEIDIAKAILRKAIRHGRIIPDRCSYPLYRDIMALGYSRDRAELLEERVSAHIYKLQLAAERI